MTNARHVSGKAHAAAFDGLAAEYDQRFTGHPVAIALREEVWRRLDARVRAGQRVLDIGCGTGVDAAHLVGRGVEVLAVDVSGAMLRTCRARLERVAARNAGGRGRWDALHIDLSEVSVPADLGAAGGELFDAALANFGVLNCLDDAALQRLAGVLRCAIRPGGSWIAVDMGPFCAWETAHYLARGDLRGAVRRWGRRERCADLGGRQVGVSYRSLNRLRQLLAPGFNVKAVRALGAVLPPTYAAGGSAMAVLIGPLLSAERRIAKWPLAVAVADHRLIEAEVVT